VEVRQRVPAVPRVVAAVVAAVVVMHVVVCVAVRVVAAAVAFNLVNGVLVGALAMIGVANIALPKLASWLQQKGVVNASNVLGSPNNWKYLVFGLVLVVMMRVRPDGLLPARLERRKAGGSA
jgi:hypothetical protein